MVKLSVIDLGQSLVHLILLLLDFALLFLLPVILLRLQFSVKLLQSVGLLVQLSLSTLQRILLLLELDLLHLNVLGLLLVCQQIIGLLLQGVAFSLGLLQLGLEVFVLILQLFLLFVVVLGFGLRILQVFRMLLLCLSQFLLKLFCLSKPVSFQLILGFSHCLYSQFSLSELLEHSLVVLFSLANLGLQLLGLLSLLLQLTLDVAVV